MSSHTGLQSTWSLMDEFTRNRLIIYLIIYSFFVHYSFFLFLLFIYYVRLSKKPKNISKSVTFPILTKDIGIY